MMPGKPRRSDDSIYALLICLAVYAVAVWQIRSYQSGLGKQAFAIPGDPAIPVISFGMRSSGNQPAVIIAHGLSASKEMMQTLGLEVAKMGVAVYLFDFPGHGTSTASFQFDLSGTQEEVIARNTERLAAYLERVYSYVREEHGGDAARLALIGHSMGSAVVTRFAVGHPEVKGVVSISPPSSDGISQSRPPNLLLLVGQWDIPQSVAGVRRALAAATDGHTELGTTYGDFSQGTARRATLLPRVDHVAIIFSPATAAEVNRWLQSALQVLYAVPTGIVRLLWLLAANLAAIVAGLLIISPLHGLVSSVMKPQKPVTAPSPWAQGAGVVSSAAPSSQPQAEPWRISIGGAVGYLVLLAMVSGLAVFFLSLRTPFSFLRLFIGDYLTSYFFTAGLLIFVLARLTRRHIPLFPRRAALADDPQAGWGWDMNLQVLSGLLVAVLLFVLLFLAVGLLGTYTWIHFIPTGARWARFIPVFLLSLPFFLADEAVLRALQESSVVGSALMSLLGKVIVLASLAAGALLAPRHFVVLLMLPLMLALFILLQLFSLRLYHVTRSALATAVLNALLVAWIMVAVFPIT